MTVINKAIKQSLRRLKRLEMKQLKELKKGNYKAVGIYQDLIHKERRYLLLIIKLKHTLRGDNRC